MSALFSPFAVPTIVSSCIAFCFVLLYMRTRARLRSRLPKPPGPKGLPLVGNLFGLPRNKNLWEVAAEWGKTYGELVYIEIAGMPMLFINSYKAAVGLLDKRSAVSSSRPPAVINELAKWDYMTINMPDNERQRKHRQHFHSFFQTADAISDYSDIQLRGTHTMLKAFLDTPEEYAKHVRRLVGSVILRNVYGHEDSPENDEYFALGEACMRSIAIARDYFFLDIVPWVKYIPEWFPEISFYKVARGQRKHAEAMHYLAHEATKEKISKGMARPSLTSVLLEESADEEGVIKQEDEDDIVAVAATAFVGGADTSVTSIMTFILAVLKNPDVQRLGQEEIDRVVGSDRLPSFEDREHLPYVRAICTEILRWEVITPLEPPHYTTSDVEYNGYIIPAKTSIHVNAWAISRNPEMYPDPLSFKPERWLGNSKKSTDDSKTKLAPSEKFAFGFGRRICPGQDWAENMIFIGVASLLATFNIEKAIGPDGRPIPPNDNYDARVVRSLPQSICKITPRSSKVVSLIQESVEAHRA